MNETALEDFLILRDLDEPVPEHAFEAAAEGAGEVLQAINDGDVGIQWVKPHVRTRADGAVTGTFCHFQAVYEEPLREHASRAGLPATRIDRHGKTLEND